MNFMNGGKGGGNEAWYTYNMEDFEAEEAPEAAE